MFYVKSTSGCYVKDGAHYIQNSLTHPIKTFESYSEALRVARRLGWGWHVTNNIRLA